MKVARIMEADISYERSEHFFAVGDEALLQVLTDQIA
jgi:hypothetical protein